MGTALLATVVADSDARLTLTDCTPGTALSAFSTRPTQEAQVIPRIGNMCSATMPGLRTTARDCMAVNGFKTRASSPSWTFGQTEGQATGKTCKMYALATQ